MSSYPGSRASFTLAGQLLVGAATSEIVVRKREVKTVYESGHGERREFLAFQDAGYPIRKWVREWSVKWAHLRDIYDQLEEILAGPAPFSFAAWKYEHLDYLGDGARSEFFLPWPLASDTFATLPSSLDAAKIQAAVKVGLAGTPLTYAQVDSATYAGTPPAGTVWFLEGGQAFKLPTAPALAAVVYARIVPAYEVIEQGVDEKRYTSPIREPRDLVLLEA